MIRIAPIALLLLVLAAPGTAAAAPTWLPAAPISDPGQTATSPRIAVDGGGGVLVAWLRPSGMSARVEARYRPPGAAFGPLEIVSQGGASQLDLAVGSDGAAVAVWVRGGRAEAAARAPGAAFGPPAPISPAGEGASEPRVAIDGLGIATTAWAGTEGTARRVRVATRLPGGAFGPAAIVDSGTDTSGGGNGDEVIIDQPRIAADPSGRAYLAYRWVERQYIGGEPQGTSYFGYTQVRQPGGAFGSRLSLSPHSGSISGFEIAAGAGGTAVVAWTDISATRIAVRVRPPAGPFGPLESPIDLSSGDLPHSPAPAVAPDGSVAVAWTVQTSGPNTVGVDVRPVGTFFPVSPQAISNPAFDEEFPLAAADGLGNFHLAWRRRTGIPQVVSARTAVPGGPFGVPIGISPPGQDMNDPSSPSVAADAEGNAAAVWARNHEGGDRVEAAGHDGAGPRFAGLAIPATGAVGRALGFWAPAFDAWSAVTAINWDFGDGGSGSGPTPAHRFRRPGDFPVSVTAIDAVGNTTSAAGLTSLNDGRRPRIRKLRLSRKRFRVGRRATPRGATAQRRRRSKPGTRVRYRLSEDARVVFTIERARPGRRPRGSRRCVKPSRAKGRRARRCTRFVRAGRLRRRSDAGRSRFRFTGRVGRRALRPGRYRLTARAIDYAGNRSRPARRAFRIARR